MVTRGVPVHTHQKLIILSHSDKLIRLTTAETPASTSWMVCYFYVLDLHKIHSLLLSANICALLLWIRCLCLLDLPDHLQYALSQVAAECLCWTMEQVTPLTGFQITISYQLQTAKSCRLNHLVKLSFSDNINKAMWDPRQTYVRHHVFISPFEKSFLDRGYLHVHVSSEETAWMQVNFNLLADVTQLAFQLQDQASSGWIQIPIHVEVGLKMRSLTIKQIM